MLNFLRTIFEIVIGVNCGSGGRVKRILDLFRCRDVLRRSGCFNISGGYLRFGSLRRHFEWWIWVEVLYSNVFWCFGERSSGWRWIETLNKSALIASEEVSVKLDKRMSTVKWKRVLDGLFMTANNSRMVPHAFVMICLRWFFYISLTNATMFHQIKSYLTVDDYQTKLCHKLVESLAK